MHTNFNILLNVTDPKGAITYIPVRLCSYVKTAYAKSPFTNTCPHCNHDVGKQNYCLNEECGKILPSKEVLSAFVFSADDRKIIDKELLNNIKKQTSKIAVQGYRLKKDTRVTIGGSYILPREFSKDELAVLGDDQVDPFYEYKLLHSATSNDKDLVVKYSTSKSGREKIGILRAEGKAIALLDIPYQELINEVDEEPDVKADKEEKEIAKQWIDSLKEVDVAVIEDNYTKIVQSIVEGKIVREEKPVKKARSSIFGKKADKADKKKEEKKSKGGKKS